MTSTTDKQTTAIATVPPRALNLDAPLEEGRIAVRDSGDNVRASWPISLDTLRQNNQHLSSEGLDALVSAFLWCIDPKHPVRLEDFARRMGYEAGTIRRMLRGRYMGAGSELLDVPKRLVDEIRKFLDLEKERTIGGKNEFVETPTALKIWRACDLARESQSPVFVTGPSHIGKTWALERYRAKNNHGRTIYCRMDAASGLGGMVRKLARAMGISDNGNTANLKSYIKHALTKDMLVIIDEVHLLQYTYRVNSFFACVEVLREIYDEAQCGFVFCGTQLFLEKLQAGTHGEMEQFMRRGVHRCKLPMQPTTKDVEAILRHWSVDFPVKEKRVAFETRDGSIIYDVPYDIMRLLARSHGLKAITERLRYARKLAEGEERRGGGGKGARVNATLAHFCKAHALIDSENIDDESGGW